MSGNNKELEESLLDLVSQASADLQEALALATSDEQKDSLTLEHITKMIKSENTILDPNEKGEWAWGPKDLTLHSFCSGRVSLLDFFTYCCINCQHVLPDLKDLESIYSSKDGFVVAGVHSAKFDNERDSESVRNAAKRMDIKHPVLNDPQAVLWTRLGIHCWPTLLLLCPQGKPILVLAGEGHRDILFRCVSVAMTHFRDKLKSMNRSSYEFFKTSKLMDIFALSFPGKICINTFTEMEPGKPYLTIADSANNRILIADVNNEILHIVGSGKADFKDGSFKMAIFNNPQGMCWIDADTLIVCDTGNHSLRKISLQTKTVELLAGTGVQGEFGDQGGLKYCQQPLASPWDIVFYKTPDMDMSLRIPVPNKDGSTNEVNNSNDTRRVLLIAMAGHHQIWALFMDTTVWWRYRTFSEGTVIPIVGSGREENRNNRYPNAAGLAQPSGLALKNNFLYISDSESSTIRKLDLSSGQVHALVGGDRNPCNLFAYGDIDGTGYSVRLQHPLSVAACPNSQSVYIADTYNHKIKVIDPTSTECKTFYPLDNNAGLKLSEPGGLCFTPDGNTMLIANTNSSSIYSLNMETKEVNSINFSFAEIKSSKVSTDEYKDNDWIIATSLITLSNKKGSKLVINFDCETAKTEEDLHLTPQAPQRWIIKFHTARDKKKDLITEWDVSGCQRSGNELPGHFEATLKSTLPEAERLLRFEFSLSLCEGGVCFMRRFATDFVVGLKSEYGEITKKLLKVMVNPDKTISIKIKSLQSL